MATKKQRADAAKKKEKRTKIFAIVGFLLLAAVAAYEVPSMMKVMNKKPPPSTYDPGPSTVAGGLPNVAVGATGSGAGQLASTSAPAATEGQLVSFDVFESKNPFAPQVSAQADASTTTDTGTTTAERPGADTAAQGAGTTTPATPTVTTPKPVTPVAPVTVPTPSVPPTPVETTPVTTTTAPPAVHGVSLKVNNVVSHVATNDTFPTGAPVFRLVGWTKSTAEISIVGGSYATGAPTLKLKLGEPVTLENQSSGKRYTVELLSTD